MLWKQDCVQASVVSALGKKGAASRFSFFCVCVFDQMSENELEECRLLCLNKNSDCFQDTCCGTSTPRSRSKDKVRKDRWGTSTNKGVATGSQSAPEQSMGPSGSTLDNIDRPGDGQAAKLQDSV